MKDLSKMTPLGVEIEFTLELRKLMKRWGASLHAVEGKMHYGICAKIGANEIPLGWYFNQEGAKP